MAKNEITFSDIVNLYDNPEKFFKEAFLSLSITKPKIRLDYAVYLYTHDKVSLGKAAEIAGLSVFEFSELLKVKDIKLKTYQDTPEDIRRSLSILEKTK